MYLVVDLSDSIKVGSRHLSGAQLARLDLGRKIDSG
jgi:hypothetical protein